MRSLRRAALIVAPVLALTLAACGSDDGTTASSTPSTPATTTSTTVRATTSVAPGSTAIGQPIPIGQETTVLAATTTTGVGAGATTPGTTTVGTRATNAATTTTSSPSGSSRTTTAASPGGGSTTSSSSSQPSSNDDGNGNSEPPSGNAATPFCVFETKVEDASDASDTEEAFIVALRGLFPQMQQWISDAPTNDLRAAATTIRDAAKQTIDTNTLDPLNGDEEIDAQIQIRAYCGGTG